MKKAWIKEVSRDLRALGSVPFYFLVTVRAVVGQYLIFLWQLLIAALCLFIVSRLVKKTDMRVAGSFVLLVFTSLFYLDGYYTVFAALIFALIVLASSHIKIRRAVIIKGIVAGIACSLIAYLLAPLI